MSKCDHYLPEKGFQLEVYHRHGQAPYLICKMCHLVLNQQQALEAIEGVMARSKK